MVNRGVQLKNDQTSAEARRKSFREALPVHERIRNRREARNLTGAQLAKRAGVSPAYVSLIERGLKVPAEAKAVAIARSLEDDPDLYRHWARAGRHPTTNDARRRYDPISADVRLRRSLAAGEPLHRINLLGSGGRVAALPQSEQKGARPAIPVPVIAEGLDPGQPNTPFPTGSDRLWLDSRLLPAQGHRELFAYLATEASAPDFRRPGGVLVMSRRVRAILEDRIYAVRLGQRIILRRVALKKTVLLLLPPHGDSDFEAISIESPQSALERLAAVTVLEIRRWW
jgi:transcriptional regulator with XRE-family HTH domain